MSFSEVFRLGSVSRDSIERMSRGYAPPTRSLQPLRALLMSALEQMARCTPRPQRGAPRRDAFPELVEYRRALFALGRRIYESTAPAPATTRLDTDLAASLLRVIGAGPVPRAVVFAHMRTAHSLKALRRCAARLGVVESLDEAGRISWSPPPSAVRPIPSLPLPPPTRRVDDPRSARGKIQSAVLRAVSASPSGALATDVVRLLLPRGYSKIAVYRAARDLQLVRDTTGWGPNRRTRWFPPTPRPETDDDDQPRGRLVEANFRQTPDES